MADEKKQSNVNKETEQLKKTAAEYEKRVEETEAQEGAAGGQQPFEEHYNRPQSMLVQLLKRRRLVPIVVGVLFLYIVYSLLTGGADKKTNTRPERSTGQQNASEIAVKPQHAQLSVEQLAAIDHTLQQKVFELREQNADNQKQLHTLQRESTEQQRLLRGIQNKMRDIEKYIKVLAKHHDVQEAELSKRVDALIKKQHSEKMKKKKKKAVRVTYTIRAIVPGRAWIESSDHHTLTVKVGDQLAGYGVIKRIDPRGGRIVMSSGTILTYGRDDS